MNSFFSHFANYADLTGQWQGQRVIGLVGEAPSKNYAQNAAWNHLLRVFELDAVYLPFDLDSSRPDTLGRLADLIADAQASNMLVGFKVAPPYKETMFELMRASASSVALRLRVINTISKIGGQLACFNTDGMGMYHNCTEAFGSLVGKSFLILGSGGAAATISDEMIQHARKLVIAARNAAAAGALQRLLMQHNQGAQKTIEIVSLEQIPVVIGDADCVINTTPVGRQGALEQFSALASTDVSAEENAARSREMIETLPSSVCFASTLYRPDKELLLRQAEQHGHRVVNGLGMWLYQAAVAAQDLFFPEALSRVAVSRIAAVLREGLAAYEQGEKN